MTKISDLVPLSRDFSLLVLGRSCVSRQQPRLYRGQAADPVNTFKEKKFKVPERDLNPGQQILTLLVTRFYLRACLLSLE